MIRRSIDRRPAPTPLIRKVVILAVAAAIALFTLAILWSSGLLDSYFGTCSVRAGDGVCLDDIARHIQR